MKKDRDSALEVGKRRKTGKPASKTARELIEGTNSTAIAGTFAGNDTPLPQENTIDLRNFSEAISALISHLIPPGEGETVTWVFCQERYRDGTREGTYTMSFGATAKGSQPSLTPVTRRGIIEKARDLIMQEEYQPN